MSKKDNSYYVVEYDNGEMFEDGCNYILRDLFKSLESAKSYIKGLSIEIYPEDYEKSVRDKLPNACITKKKALTLLAILCLHLNMINTKITAIPAIEDLARIESLRLH